MNDSMPDDGSAFTDEMPEMSVPAFQAGGRVERTGIALVHEGEYIMPAPGSEAQIVSEDQADGTVINYYFPVEIEVIGALSDAQLSLVAEYVCDALNTALRSRV